MKVQMMTKNDYVKYFTITASPIEALILRGALYDFIENGINEIDKKKAIQMDKDFLNFEKVELMSSDIEDGRGESNEQMD